MHVTHLGHEQVLALHHVIEHVVEREQRPEAATQHFERAQLGGAVDCRTRTGGSSPVAPRKENLERWHREAQTNTKRTNTEPEPNNLHKNLLGVDHAN